MGRRWRGEQDSKHRNNKICFYALMSIGIKIAIPQMCLFYFQYPGDSGSSSLIPFMIWLAPSVAAADERSNSDAEWAAEILNVSQRESALALNTQTISARHPGIRLSVRPSHHVPARQHVTRCGRDHPSGRRCIR